MIKYVAYNKKENKFDNGRGELVEFENAMIYNSELEIDLNSYDEPEEWEIRKISIILF